MRADFRHYADLVFFKAWSELKIEGSRTFIGVAWWILDPVIYMAVFYVVFAVFFERGGDDFVQFLLIGLVFFRWFGNSVNNGALSIRQGHNLMQQVYLPKIVFPLVTFVSDGFKFLFTLALLLTYLWSTGFTPGWQYLALLPLIGIQIIFLLGCMLCVAAVVPVIPDLKFLVNHGITIMLFTSGVFYDVKMLSPEIQEYVLFNPMANLLVSYRDVLMFSQWPDFYRLLPSLLAGLLMLSLGVGLIHYLDRRYPKIVRMRGA